MKPVKTISPPEWATSPQSIKLMKALGEQDALFVGGCVRNTLLGVDVSDIDIATKHHPEAVIEILKSIDAKAIPTGIEHGTVTAVLDGAVFEITTLRKDVETDGRRASIAFADHWEDDAERRDFTMNTLLMNTSGEVFDPTGQGIDDLKACHVRFVGNPEQRIIEDYLRILRFFRFHAFYGQGEMNSDALKACAKHANTIKTLSKERITQEFSKILSVNNPMDIARIMAQKNVLQHVIPEHVNDDGMTALGKLCDLQTQHDMISIPARLLIIAGIKVENLTLSKAFSKEMKAINAAINLNAMDSEDDVKIVMYRYGRDTASQALLTQTARNSSDKKYMREALAIIKHWEIPKFPITGEDLMQEGIPQGPELGEELKRREDAWIENGFSLQ